VNHHWALGTGHRAAELAAVAELLGLESARSGSAAEVTSGPAAYGFGLAHGLLT